MEANTSGNRDSNCKLCGDSAFILICWSSCNICMSGKDPIASYQAIWRGAFGNGIKFADTLDRSTVLMLSGLAAALAFRTNVINLGLEGQLYAGAFAAALVGFSVHGLPNYLHIPLCLCWPGLLVGGLWGLPVILLKLRWGITELVTTLMLNYIAIRFTEYSNCFPFQATLLLLCRVHRCWMPQHVCPKLGSGICIEYRFHCRAGDGFCGVLVPFPIQNWITRCAWLVIIRISRLLPEYR